jgi:hypothetical protein
LREKDDDEGEETMIINREARVRNGFRLSHSKVYMLLELLLSVPRKEDRTAPKRLARLDTFFPV